MAGTSLGTAWIQIKPTTSGITSAVKKELDKTEQEVSGTGGKLSSAFSSLGQKAGASLKVGLMAAATAATASTIALVKSAVTSFADYEQLVGGVDTLFKGSSSAVQQYAQNAFKTAQLSANQYMETVTSFSASLIQSLGGDTDKAAKYADQAIIDMADNANKMGTSIEMIQNAYQGFAKQNYTMLDNLKLGYGGTETEMERLLADASKLSGVAYQMGNFADMTAAIHVIQENLGIAGTSSREASQTISGSLNAMKAAWSNLVVGISDDTQNFDTLLDNFVTTAGEALTNLVPTLMTALQGIGQLITQAAPILIAQLPVLIQTLLPQLLNSILQITTALANNLPGILVSIVNSAITFLTDPATIESLFNAAVVLFFSLVKAVPEILGALLQAFGNLLGNAWDWIKQKFGEFAAGFGEFITGIFKGAVNGILTFIENFINTPIDILNGFIGIINGAFGWIGVNLGKINRIQLPRLATGGVVEGVGTDTSDSNLYALSRGEYVINAATARQIGYDNLDQLNETGTMTMGNQTNNFYIDGAKDPKAIANEVSRILALNSKGVMA